MAHPLALLFILAVVIFGIVVALWNFVPSWRDKMRGYSTVVEGVITIAVGIFGQVSGAIQDAQAAGYIPPNLAAYVPFVLLAWFVVQRLRTQEPVGPKLTKVANLVTPKADRL